MAYIINQPEPAAVIIEQHPPSVFLQPAPQHVIIDQYPLPPVAAVQPTVMQSPMKSLPASIKCQFCQRQVVTVTRPVNGLITWTIFGTLFVFFIWPFCLIPFCTKSCRDVEHSCPNCRNIVHIHKRM